MGGNRTIHVEEKETTESEKKTLSKVTCCTCGLIHDDSTRIGSNDRMCNYRCSTMLSISGNAFLIYGIYAPFFQKHM
jgi:hypothetical protein